ncbi:MAG: DUF2213 domain-containing protein [bacterium]
MLAFCGTRISENMSVDNAGNLVCHGATIARTGTQHYRGAELGLDTDDLVAVYRDAAEVFSPAAIASAEGKLVTDSHPPRFLSPGNAGAYARGHVQNVREGPGLADGNRTLVADLVVHDANLISKILDGGLRELSCGYDCEYEPQSDGSYRQRKIRVNHVALVANGRCGAACRVKDSEEITMTKREQDIAKAMAIIAEIQEAFGPQKTQDADDGNYGRDMKRFHRRGIKLHDRPAKVGTQDGEMSWAEKMNAYGRAMREQK